MKHPLLKTGIWLGLLFSSVVLFGQEAPFQANGGLTLVGLHADHKQVQSDQTLSADLFLQGKTRRGQWLVYIEGNSSLSYDNVSNVYIESNADAGSARDPDRKGRVQISEFNYRFINKSDSQLTVGLIDPSSYLDRSRITNDENTQFLGASFVNNPTIEFPDYTLGLAYEKPATKSLPQLKLVLSNTHGLADNPNLSYSQLLQRNRDTDGVFAALGMGWLSNSRLFRLGFWINDQDHISLEDKLKQSEMNYGTYAVLGQSRGAHSLNLRFGLANAEVSAASAFSSIAYRYQRNDVTVGLGLAKSWLSSHAADNSDNQLNDFRHVELYLRRSINENIHLSASVQHLQHSGFINTDTDPRYEALILGLRMHVSY